MNHHFYNWLQQLHAKTLHGLCSGITEDENEVASRIRFLAKFQKPKAVILGVFVCLLVWVGAFCLGGNNPIVSGTEQGEPLTIPAESAQRYPNFSLSIVKQGGNECYRLDATSGDEYLLWDVTQNEWTFYREGQSLILFSQPRYDLSAELLWPETIALQDLTQDGVPELVFLQTVAENAACETVAQVIDRTTMTAYALPQDNAAVAAQIEVAPTGYYATEEDGHYLNCEVIYQLRGQNSFASMVQTFETYQSFDQARAACAYQPEAQQGLWSQFELTEDGLTYTLGVQTEGQVPWEYLANIKNAISYDSTRKAFVLGELLSVKESLLSAQPEEYADWTAQPAEPAPTVGGLSATQPQMAQTRADYTIWQADLTHDGQMEEILWDDISFADTGSEPLYVQQAGATELPRETALWRTQDWQSISTSHVGNVAYSVYHDDAGDYLLRYQEAWYSGSCEASYALFSLTAQGTAQMAAEDVVQILPDGMPYNSELNDVDAILSFFEVVSNYHAKSYLLVSTLGEVSYYNPVSNQVVDGERFQSSSAEEPLQVIPSLMLSNAAPRNEDGTVVGGEEADAGERLRLQLEAFNLRREKNYAELLAEAEAANAEKIKEIGLPEPFTALPTYASWVAADAQNKPEVVRPSMAMDQQNGTIYRDTLGNRVRYQLMVAEKAGETLSGDVQSWLLPSEVYWNGVYCGDMPNSVDRWYWDFNYVQDFLGMQEIAQEIPTGAHLQLTLDTSADGNHKKASMIACQYYSKNGTVLDSESVFYADVGADGVMVFDIPSLDYRGEELLILKFTAIVRDDTVDAAEDRLVFSLVCQSEPDADA